MGLTLFSAQSCMSTKWTNQVQSGSLSILIAILITGYTKESRARLMGVVRFALWFMRFILIFVQIMRARIIKWIIRFQMNIGQCCASNYVFIYVWTWKGKKKFLFCFIMRSEKYTGCFWYFFSHAIIKIKQLIKKYCVPIFIFWRSIKNLAVIIIPLLLITFVFYFYFCILHC